MSRRNTLISKLSDLFFTITMPVFILAILGGLALLAYSGISNAMK